MLSRVKHEKVEYTSAVWSPYNKENISTIDNVQMTTRRPQILRFAHLAF